MRLLRFVKVLSVVETRDVRFDTFISVSESDLSVAAVVFSKVETRVVKAVTEAVVALPVSKFVSLVSADVLAVSKFVIRVSSAVFAVSRVVIRLSFAVLAVSKVPTLDVSAVTVADVEKPAVVVSRLVSRDWIEVFVVVAAEA
jgi:hypothetical protein